MSALVLRGGTVVDGTGAPGRIADVEVRDGRIAAIAAPGSLDRADGTVIDVTGAVVAPGFVDLHTHYDAQLFWDPAATPSTNHGVTTVFGGNCGFGLAPAGPEHADYLARLMSRVEGIPLAAIEAAVPWDWSGFGEWLDRLEANGTAVNAGFLAGHCALRRAVLGERAVTDPATPVEIEAMVAGLRDALDAGALGFSTSRSHTHHDMEGNPVPSRLAADDELLALAGALADYDGTQLEAIVPGCINGFSDDEMDLLAAMSVTAGRPLNWNVLGIGGGDGHLHQLAASDRAAERGGRVVALTMPTGMGLRLSFVTGMVLDALPGWADLFGLAADERIAALADPAWRQRLDDGAHAPEAGIIGLLAEWGRLRVVEVFAAENAGCEGRSIRSIAEQRGASDWDTLCDIVVADELRTGLSPQMPAESDEVWQARRAVWRDPRAVVGGSDAGAHLDMMCGAVYSTSMVGPIVRDHRLLSIEEAVHLITQVPAELYGVRDRGVLAPGAHADVVVFDPATVGPRPERTRDDLPGGASRLVADADGVAHVFVNGTEILRDGAPTGATPGTVLRAGRDTTTVPPAPVPRAAQANPSSSPSSTPRT